MSRRHEKIGAGLKKFLHKDVEIMTGTVVAGSVDMDEYTMMVLPTNGDDAIGPVMLNGIAGNGNGLLLIPADGSDVIVGCVDGPGEWCLIRASNLVEVLVTIGDQVFGMKDGKFSMKNGSQDYKTLMDTHFTNLAAMTFTNGAGTTGPANNITDLQTDQSNFDELFY